MYIRHQFWSLQMAKYWKNCLAIWSHCFPAPPLQKSFYLWISITFPVFGRPLRRYCKVLLPYYSLITPLWVSITFPVFGRPLRRYCKVVLPYYSLWLPYYSLITPLWISITFPVFGRRRRRYFGPSSASSIWTISSWPGSRSSPDSPASWDQCYTKLILPKHNFAVKLRLDFDAWF